MTMLFYSIWGAIYKLTDEQQIFANFSQGFSFPDVQRMMRDAFNISTANIQPISVNSYELGWRLQGAKPKSRYNGFL